MRKWILNKLLKGAIRRERKRQIKLGYTIDSDTHKGSVNLTLIARQFEEVGKYVQALALLEAATENNKRVYI